MKKLIANILVVALLVCCLTACGAAPEKAVQTVAPTEEAMPEPEPTEYPLEENLAKAEMLFEAGSFSEAAPILEELAELDCAAACAMLGHMYDYGDELKQDYAKAVELYKKALEIDAGNLMAMTGLAEALMGNDGDVVEIDYEKSREYLTTAAEAGYPEAMHVLGAVYVNGIGVEADTDLGIEWLEKAAEANYASARNYLGQMCAYDFGNNFDFYTTDKDGNVWTGADFAEYELVIVNMWEVWCGPCVEEMPALERIYEEYADKGLLVVGVYSDDSPEEVEAIAKDKGITYPLLHSCSAFASLAVSAVPATYFIRGNGEIVRHSGVDYALQSMGMANSYSDLVVHSVYVGGRDYNDWNSLVHGLLK